MRVGGGVRVGSGVRVGGETIVKGSKMEHSWRHLLQRHVNLNSTSLLSFYFCCRNTEKLP